MNKFATSIHMICKKNSYRLVHNSVRGFASAFNPRLSSLQNNDTLYHLGLTDKDKDYFSDVQFLCCGGTPKRMKIFADLVASELKAANLYDFPYGFSPVAIGKEVKT